MHKYSGVFFGLLAWAAISSTAQAHIKLLKPESWLNEDNVGGPQKGGPCGPGSFDDVQPVPMSMKVTTVTAGDTIMVEFDETVHHPGWFRIALAEDPSDFEEIDFPNTSDCNYDLAKVPKEPHGNVLADGLGMDSALGGPNRKFKEAIKLPDTPCEKCTLQVIQVMADALHVPPGCVYYHCAELKILAKGGAAAGSGGSPGAATAGTSGAAVGAAGAAATGGTGGAAAPAGSAGVSGAAGKAGASATAGPSAGATGGITNPVSPAAPGAPSAAAGSSAPAGSDGGCSVASPATGSSLSALSLFLAAFWLARRRAR